MNDTPNVIGCIFNTFQSLSMYKYMELPVCIAHTKLDIQYSFYMYVIPCIFTTIQYSFYVCIYMPSPVCITHAKLHVQYYLCIHVIHTYSTLFKTLSMYTYMEVPMCITHSTLNIQYSVYMYVNSISKM